MKDEIKEILNNADSNTKFKMVDEDGTEKEMNIAGLIEQLLNDNKHLLDYITNLQEKVNQYENPDDMTLFYMWLDEKAKDKMKELQTTVNNCKERIAYLERSNNRREDTIISLRMDITNSEDIIDKAINEVIRIIEIILEQPSKDKLDDLWIISKLEGIQILLQGEDKDE